MTMRVVVVVVVVVVVQHVWVVHAW